MNSNRPISRRNFARLLGVSAAATALARTAYSRPPTAATGASPTTQGVVRLSSNENPYGPSASALQAMGDSFSLANRYPDEHADALVEAIAKLNSVSNEQVLIGDGSGEILKLCAAAYTGPASKNGNGGGALVVADPTFEAILNHSQVAGAEVVKVPLTSTFAHDLPEMSAAAKNGLIYICNPNNPTASITPKKEIRDFIAHMPRQTMILVDEAYFHFADSADYESVIPMVKDYPNLMVARTFSKIYGMAGMRCGYCIAQKDAIDRLRTHQPWDSVNIMAIVGAVASLNDAELVPNGQRLINEARAFTISELEKLGYKTIPSQANFIMTDVKRPVKPLIAAMKERNVQVGRLFPALPNHMRITIGKKSEMDAFLGAFRQVMA